jgi:hypothetical protein
MCEILAAISREWFSCSRSQLSPCSESSLLMTAIAWGVPELPKEDISAAPIENAEDAGILDLTDELKLRPPKLDEASTNQDWAEDEPHADTLSRHGIK